MAKVTSLLHTAQLSSALKSIEQVTSAKVVSLAINEKNKAKGTNKTNTSRKSKQIISTKLRAISETQSRQLLTGLPPRNLDQKRYASSSSSKWGASLSAMELELQQQNFGQEIPGVQQPKPAFQLRDQLSGARRVIIKLGANVITQETGQGLALGRLAAIIEQVAELQNNGVECIIVTCGAIGFGRQKLSTELLMSMSMRDTFRDTLSGHDRSHQQNTALLGLAHANAAVGQSGLMALYETMFRNYGILVGQVLVTAQDFQNTNTRNQLFNTMRDLMALNIIPIINANDVTEPAYIYKDNDSIACRVATAVRADLCILMCDVDGIYNKPPGEEGAKQLDYFNPKYVDKIEAGDKSKEEIGGLDSRVVSAATFALNNGCSVVICNGMMYNTLTNILGGTKVGTMFTQAENDSTPAEVLAQNARTASRKLQRLLPEERAHIIQHVASSLVTRTQDIMEANQQDLTAASQAGIAGPLYSRLAITPSKLEALSSGLMQIAERSYNNVGKIVRRTQVSDTIEVVQKTVPIGVLMVIFESRPDALPQVAALAVASANGLVMKGGKEAANSNKVLIQLVKEALSLYGCEDAVSLVSGREEVSDLLAMDEYIDLIIPRGSTEMVRNIKDQSKHIPVLGHAEGICHVYLDKEADLDKAVKIVMDAKTNYPAACNAVETVLIHQDLLNSNIFEKVCGMLKKSGVSIYSGPRLSSTLTFCPPPAEKLRHEYGDLACTVEIVADMDEAIQHIHKFGSGHTEVIVTEDKEEAEKFLAKVDSACVFHNASSRFADGYRLGLGAEVGISTGRIHARGPVGVEGLLTTKWILKGRDDTAQEYEEGHKAFIHLPLSTET